ncbi:MAG: ABC transporter substrate-binding protein [Rhizobiaceae bacterium]
MRKLLISSLAILAMAGTAAAEEVTIRVHYAIPTIWSDAQAKLAEAFMAENPDVNIVIDGAAEGYEDGVQRILRESVAGNAPDVAYVGLNLWRVLESRGLAQPLDGFIGDEAEFEAKGYTPALRSLGQFNDTQYALGTSASTLVIYVNPDLVEQAGGSMDDFPTDFDGIIELAAAINDLSPTIDGIWTQRHDWRFQSFLGAYGGRPMTPDESDITFDDEAGIAAATLFQRFAQEGGMQSYNEQNARQAFPAGSLGIMVESSSLLTRFLEGADGRFEVVVKPLPIMAEPEDVYFPTGGSALVMLTDDEAKQEAAWRYMMFATGPEGAKIIVENTGFAPTNALVIEDETYLADFYAENPMHRPAHEQVAQFAGPWYAFPGPEGVAVTDLIAAAMVEVSDGGADPEETVKELAETLRERLGMK